jgi:hypothetical protein
MNKVNQAVVVSWVMKLLPVVLMALVTKGCLTAEQAGTVQPVAETVIQWIAQGVLVVSLVIAAIRSLKTHGG